MIPAEAIGIGDDPTWRRRFDRYLGVADNRLPAKFRLAAAIPVAIEPATVATPDLWKQLKSLTDTLDDLQKRVFDGENVPLARRETSLLSVLSELAQRSLEACDFCAWDCGVDRAAETKFGTCKLGNGSRVSTFFHHQGEELIYRGRLGSGTIFFTSCNMRCAFCQNGDISTDKDNGVAVDARQLAVMAWMLRREGCHNINWVGGDPTIHLHTILEAIRILGHELSQPDRLDLAGAVLAKADPVHPGPLDPALSTHRGLFNVPMLWNSNFIMSEAAMKLLRPVIDIWLPDFKFGPGSCAKDLARTPWYWEVVTRNLAMVHAWREPFTIRHLVMPNHVECCTRPVLEWIAENLSGVPVNVMAQYHPDTFTDPRNPGYREKYEPLARRPRRGELEASYRIARDLGIVFEGITFEGVDPRGFFF